MSMVGYLKYHISLLKDYKQINSSTCSIGDTRQLEDGGKTWKKTLGDAEWTGVTDIVIDPRNPDVLYAATWQRHRTVAAYLGGGPNSGIHKSVDGGETWEKLSTGR